MITQQAQIKVNLPIQLKDHLESKASKFGMPLAGYIKYLILKEVSMNDYPVFSVSEQTEQAYEKAKKEEIEGKISQVKDLDTFFDNM